MNTPTIGKISSIGSGFRLALGAAVLFAAFGCDTGKSVDSASKPPATSESSNPSSSGAARPVSTGEGNKYSTGKIVIGLVASENGELRPWGADAVSGAKLAVDEFNKAGGVGGKLVDLRIEDSGSKPEQGKSAAEKLISDGALGILGEVSSGITAQMGIAAFDKGVPDIAIGATRTTLTDLGNNMFRVCYTDSVQGPVMANFAYNELKLRNVALMTDKKQIYSTGLSESFRAAFTKLGGTIVDEQFYESGNTQFSGQLTNLKAKSPDGLFCSGYFNEVGPIVKQAKEAGLVVKCLGGDGWDSSQILTLGGDAILGSYFCNHYNSQESRPEVKAFLTKWKAAYPDNPVPATTMGALAYDATSIMCDSLKRAKSLDSKGLRDAIDDTSDFKGVSGVITLRGNNGNPPKRALVVQLKPATPTNPSGQVFAKAYEPGEATN